MASEDDSDSLKVYWDHFFKSETGTYEKTTWLDLFLAEFLIRVKNGANPKELIGFCPVSGVVTLVGCELLCGLHRVTSSISHLATPLPLPVMDASCSQQHENSQNTVPETEPKPEEPRGQLTSLFTRHNSQTSAEILRKYLLGGVAWKCLAMLKAIGIEGLSCCRQLSSVLIWVFGELSTSPGPEHCEPHPAPRGTPIHQLFSTRIWSKQKPKSTNSPGTKVNSADSSERGSSTGRSRHSATIKTDSIEKTKRNLMKDLTSESAESNDDLQDINKSMTVKVSPPKDDLDYTNSPSTILRSSSEYPDTLYGEPYYTPRKNKPRADDYMTDKQRELINKEISSFEFLLLITDLLQELCKADSSLSGSEGSQISVQCINFTLRNLCSLQFGSVPGQCEPQKSRETSRIKVALTELLIVSLDKVLIHSDLCAKLIHNGILPMLLRLLEDIIRKSSSRYQAKSDNQKRAKEIEPPCETESENLLKFVFGIAYSVTAFFHCLLMQCRSVEKLREFTEQFKLYSECLKGALLRDCIELMIRIPGTKEEDTVVLVKKLIESIGRLISGMKRVRSEVIHSAACPRNRHKMCRQRVMAGMHHHHDILGEASTGMPISASCCVSILYKTLTSLVADEEIAQHPTLRNKLLKVMLHCGVCCCFAPGVLMESIVRLMLTHHCVSAMCLQLLEYTVYGELGANILLPKVTDQLPCSICEPRDEDNRETVKKYCPHGVNPVERKNTWSFLIHYNSLLQLDNHNNVLHATVSHLLRITPKCRAEMKYELLFSVIYPTFIVAKHRYVIRLEDSAFFLTASCLNIFATLLNTVTFAEQFIQKGGLSYVLELVSMTEFANQCCSILEIAIIVEILKLIKENSEVSPYREMSSLASVQMLFKSLSDMTDKFYKIYKLKLPVEQFEELCDLTNERDMLAFMPDETSASKRKMSAPMDIKANVDSEREVEECIEDYIEILKNVCTFWKSCAGLCVNAPLFRAHVASEAVFLDSFAMLKLALAQVCGRDCAPAEMRLLVRLIEALLTVHFAVSEATSGRSKQTSCKLVRSTLGSLGSPSAGLRPLCEALVRVASAPLSTRHTLPRPPSVKVPPLLCPSGSSSGAASTTDDSVSGPYASEHSDVVAARPDEGYEADVEIAVLEIQKSRLFAISDSSFAAGVAAALGQHAAPEEQSAAELAHPELCALVVDVLTRIVNRVMDAVEDNAPTPEDTWSLASAAASIARCVAGRLSRAAPPPESSAPPAPPPPSLLRKLLAPRPARLLASTSHKLHELRASVVEVVQALGCRRVSAGELAALLRLAGSAHAPQAALLAALLRLLRAHPANAPDFLLAFPIDKDDYEQARSVSEQSATSSTSATPISPQADGYARRLIDLHTRAGLKSAWSVSAARVGVEAGWGAWLAGFSLALWLRHTHYRRSPDSPACDDADDWQEESGDSGGCPGHQGCPNLLHVISVGNDSLMFEMWMNIATGTVVFRASRGETGAAYTAEGRLECAVPPRLWALVAVNVCERLMRRRIHVQVTMYVNGFEYETLNIPLPGVLVRKATTTIMLLGDCGGVCARALQLADVRLYRAPLMTHALALRLATQPPTVAPHILLEHPNFPAVVTADILDSNLDWDQVYDMSSSALRELHDNVLLWYSAHAPYVANLYYQSAVAMPTVFGGKGPSGSGTPEVVRVEWRGVPRARRMRTFATALCTLAGIPHLLYLFARVVELGGSADEQALALRVMLRAGRGDARLYGQLLAADTLDMLHAVLASPRCHVGPPLLQVILEESCSGPILSSAGGGALLVLNTNAAVLEPLLIVFIMRAWKQFDQQELQWEMEGETGRWHGSAWALALAACGALLRLQHPRRAHNARALRRAALLPTLLAACKERFLSSECAPLSAECSRSLVSLVSALLAAPPTAHHLALLADFLLLMHQASDTFVTHSRANFYFLLTPDTPDMNEFAKSSLRRKPSRREKKKSNTGVDSGAADNNINTAKDATINRESDEKPNPETTTESVKEMKGIINEQIKESSKHVETSPTSDTTDPPLERWRGSDSDMPDDGGAAPDSSTAPDPEPVDTDLNEYIVVDMDDAKNTNDDLYTGGIYEKRKLRAGAEPGWTACEGLLLLLRDTIAVLPEPQLTQALAGAVSAQTLVVLANHRCGAVRAALVRALAALQRRAPHAAPAHCYHHLANQISLYEGTWELASACASLITKCDVPLEDQLEGDIWVEASEEWVQRCPPLLALLPRCLPDVALAHNITLILRRLVDKSPLRALVEVCMPEVCVRAVREAGALGQRREGGALLARDLHQLLAALATKALAAPHAEQVVCDIHYMLTFAERTSSGPEPSTEEEEEAAEVESEAEGGGARAACRSAQVALYMAELDYLEHRLAAAPHHHAGYLTTVLTSAVSLGGDRGAGARLLGGVARALQFLLGSARPPPDHAALYTRLLTMLLNAGAEGGSRARWAGEEWSSLLREAVWWAAGQPTLQAPLLRALYAAPPASLAALTPPHPAHNRKLAVYVVVALQAQHLAAEGGGAGAAELAVTAWARGWALTTQAALPERLAGAALPAEARRLRGLDRARWAAARAAHAPHVLRAVFSKEALASRLAEEAMAMTRRVVEAQNDERKGFMQHLRRAHAARSRAYTRWRALIDDHTHERAVWYNARSYPQSWQLDPTEGPSRERLRLRRAHLRLRPRHLLPQHRYKAELAMAPPPLHGVVGGGAGGALAARLELSETVAYMARVTHVSVDGEAAGELLLTDRSIHFVPEEAEGGGEAAQCWSLSRVVRVAARRWCLQERALEVFVPGRAHLLAFAAETERAAFLRALDSCHLPNRIEADTLSEAMAQWRSGNITNWEYLMRLNGLGGRSYNDLMQYPVLPFVLADYTSRVLDLTSPDSYRDLSRPVAVQRKEREQHYINTYNDLKLARREGCGALVGRAPHHYAALYSNSGAVLHYLVRLPPYTELFLHYQDNNFDMPDRTFHSLATTWRLITKDSPTDVKELIPELFYMPELFHNNEGLALGVRQCGLGVDNVEVPAWAAEARLFTLLHRQALESPIVTDALPRWIDLVFGYKQTGQAALDAINVFPACTYYGFDPMSLEDEVERTAAAAMVRTYGQAPRQLLRAPHPHAARDLLPRPPAQVSACGGALGVRWGRYCGSPELPPPAVTARRRTAAAGLLPLAAPRARTAALLPPNTALVMLQDEEGCVVGGGAEAACALVSWAHADGLVRLTLRRDTAPRPLLYEPPADPITCVWCGGATWSGGASGSRWEAAPLVVGFVSGRVEAWRLAAGGRASRRLLLAHAAPVAAVHAAPTVALLASASRDGRVVLWDLARLTYIRTLPNRGMLPVTKVTISPTLSDVATVHKTTPRYTRDQYDDHDDCDDNNRDGRDDGDDDQAAAYEQDAPEKYQSIIRVYTVNGRFVGSVRVSERVESVSYSCAPEGASVNVVAAGLAGGGVRLYSSWDLRPLATLAPARAAPLHSLSYSCDSQLLFGCYADGTAVVWESEPQRAPPRFVPALALL